MPSYQKLCLGAFLFLNVFMVITACIRASGLYIRSHNIFGEAAGIQGAFDEVWLFLWQQIEASVAVTMVSLTAFRSIYVLDRSRKRKQPDCERRWYSSVVMKTRSGKKPSETREELGDLPSIPPATLTGLTTAIHGGMDKRPINFGLESTYHNDLESNSTENQIQVSYTFDYQVQEAKP